MILTGLIPYDLKKVNEVKLHYIRYQMWKEAAEVRDYENFLYMLTHEINIKKMMCQ